MILTPDTVAGFVSALLQKNFDGAVESPACHYEWWSHFCDGSQYVAIAAPRGHAKSTALTFGYTLAALCFRARSYVIIVSDTASQSIQFLGDIKKELYDNEQLRALFKIKDFEKETEDDIICNCEDGYQFRVQAKGSEQKVRGLKWNNKRPDLIICDDLENDEIVMNKERREKFRQWFFKALLPARSANGIVRYVGTVLHADSLLERLMPKEYDKKTVMTPLKTYSTKSSTWKAVKYKAHDPDFTNILWPQNFSKERLLEIRNSYVEQGLAEGYSQEYLNVPIDETISYYRRADFLPLRPSDKEKKILNFYITSDLAISQSEHADYSVFLIAAVDENRHIQIRDVVRQRLDGKEIVDTVLALERAWKPEVLGIEEMQVSKAIGPFLREEMVRQNTYPNLVQLKNGGKDKPSRSKSMQARVRAHTVRFDKEAEWYQDFEDECCTFPRARNDDQFDAFGYLGMLLDMVIEASTPQEIEEQEYYDELEEAGLTTRNATTGY
jgi:predicted phage terminase large subunit-like protein